MICTYDGGTWAVEFKSRPPVDHGPGNSVDALPVLGGVFGAFGMFLGAVNAVAWLRRKRRTRAVAAASRSG